MNLVLDDAEEIHLKKKIRKKLGPGDSVRTEPVPGAKDDAPTVPVPSL
jgi:small nuclear ribonucleoprotein (snRNP)-like protein